MARTRTAGIRPDESLILFPTLGRLDAGSGCWELPIHGWVFKPEVDSVRRAAAISLLRHWLGVESGSVEASLFEHRLRAFLVDNQPRRSITIRIADALHSLARSNANGHFQDVVTFTDGQIAAPPGYPADPAGERWQTFAIVPAANDERTFGGSVHLLADEGLSVISDIDDTIKITHVQDRQELLKQTFLREFEAVPGMSDAYARWRTQGAAFHYVSRSPWQLYEPLAEFVAGHGFPTGTFHMRHFRWKNASTMQPDKSGAKKLAVIAEMIERFPRRRYVCVGDSGEHDPEVYGALARQFPERIARVFIRNVTGEAPQATRFQDAMSALPAAHWQVFSDAAELPQSLSAVL